MSMEALIGLLIIIICPAVLLSNWTFYQKSPQERWPMVLVATAIWWGPITGLGWLLWDIPAWFAGAQLLCLVSAFFATMTLKFLWYRRAAFKAQSPQLVLWQREMLDDIGYSLSQQAQHVQQASKDRLELKGLLHRMQERQAALDEAIRQTELYRQISQQTLDDFMEGVMSCYLARKHEVQANMNKGRADDFNEEGI